MWQEDGDESGDPYYGYSTPEELKARQAIAANNSTSKITIIKIQENVLLKFKVRLTEF